MSNNVTTTNVNDILRGGVGRFGGVAGSYQGVNVGSVASSWSNDTKEMKDRLATIEERLLILVPDPQKIEQYEALKIAYEHYKTLENLLK